MKIEQSIMTFNMGTSTTNSYYIDLARCLSAVNGKMISQTKRSDGKYKPLGFMIRVRALGDPSGGAGAIVLQSLNCGYPTRNAVVLAGAARDAMLKSAGVSRGNLESYQKELRLGFECAMDDSTSLAPGATSAGFGPDYKDAGTHTNSYGNQNLYDYTSIVFDDPANPGTDVQQKLVVLGGAPVGPIADEKCAPVVYNWHAWRHSFTPSSADDDIADNVFSYTMQQSSTADAIIDIVQDEADEKPYALSDFTTKTIPDFISTSVGNPATTVFCAPLGLLKVGQSAANQAFQIEVLGVTEL